MREYTRAIPEYADVFTLPEWQNAINAGFITEYDGIGFWVKDDKESTADVFSTWPEDATHVAWYNK